MRRKMERTATAYKSHDSIANAVRLTDILNTTKNKIRIMVKKKKKKGDDGKGKC